MQERQQGAPLCAPLGVTPRDGSVDLPGREDHTGHCRFAGRLLVDETNARRGARDHRIDLVSLLVFAHPLRDHDGREFGVRDHLLAVAVVDVLAVRLEPEPDQARAAPAADLNPDDREVGAGLIEDYHALVILDALRGISRRHGDKLGLVGFFHNLVFLARGLKIAPGRESARRGENHGRPTHCTEESFHRYLPLELDYVKEFRRATGWASPTGGWNRDFGWLPLDRPL